MIPDPTVDPGAALSLGEKLYHSGAFFCLGILVVYELLRWLDQHVKWFETGKRAAYTAASLGGLAVLAIPAMSGATPNAMQLATAFATAYTLLRSPVKPATSSGGGGGSYAMKSPPVLLVLAIALVVFAVGCAKVQAVEHAAAPCAESTLSKELAPTVETILTVAANTWEAQLEALAAAYGKDFVSCVVQGVATKLAAKQAGDENAKALERAKAYHDKHKTAAIPRGAPAVAIRMNPSPAMGL